MIIGDITRDINEGDIFVKDFADKGFFPKRHDIGDISVVTPLQRSVSRSEEERIHSRRERGARRKRIAEARKRERDSSETQWWSDWGRRERVSRERNWEKESLSPKSKRWAQGKDFLIRQWRFQFPQIATSLTRWSLTDWRKRLGRKMRKRSFPTPATCMRMTFFVKHPETLIDPKTWDRQSHTLTPS